MPKKNLYVPDITIDSSAELSGASSAGEFFSIVPSVDSYREDLQNKSESLSLDNSPRQLACLRAIVSFTEDLKRPPTCKDLAITINGTVKKTRDIVNKLKSKGLVYDDPYCRNGIVATDDGRAVASKEKRD